MIFGNNNYVRARGKNKSKVFIVRKYGSSYQIEVKRICFPKEFVGRRLRLKVEFVEDKNE